MIYIYYYQIGIFILNKNLIYNLYIYDNYKPKKLNCEPNGTY